MANNCRLNYIVRNYINRVQRIVDVCNYDIKAIKVTNSISCDAIEQILLYEKSVVDMIKHTLKFTVFDPVIELNHRALREREEIICDLENISGFCRRYSNSPVAVRNYNSNFRTIIKNTIDKQKSISYSCNLNIYFLNLIGESDKGCVKILENLSKYRICPQLRLISEYMIRLNRREIINMKEILNLMV